MRTSDSADLIHTAIARSFFLGALAGLILLAICLLENIANLGYAVLDGGVWALLGLVGSFGIAFGALSAAVLLTALSLGTTAPAFRPARYQHRKQRSALPRL